MTNDDHGNIWMQIKKCLTFNVIYLLFGFGLFIGSIMYIFCNPTFSWSIVISITTGVTLIVLAIASIVKCIANIGEISEKIKQHVHKIQS